MVDIEYLKTKSSEVYSGDLLSRIPYATSYSREYCTANLVRYRDTLYRQLKKASVEIDQIYYRVLRFVQRELPDPFLVNNLGIHPDLVATSRLEVPFHGVSRQDWIVTPDNEIRFIENNVDTPTGIPESFYAPLEILKGDRFRDQGLPRALNPNSKLRGNTRSALSRLIDYYRQQGLTGTIAFSATSESSEDLENARFLIDSLSTKSGLRTIFAPLESLEVRADEGLFFDNEKIDIWYRLYPLEYLVHDLGEDGFPVGTAILDLVLEGKLGMINPVQSIISQSKGFYALIYTLYEHTDFFSEAERKIISSYFLPTYFTPTPFTEQNLAYVAKSIFGREGKGVSLFNEEGFIEAVEFGSEADSVAFEETKEYYQSQPTIYQRRIEMSSLRIKTNEGFYDGYLLTGVYVIGGAYSGILSRIGSQITGDLAYYASSAVIKGA